MILQVGGAILLVRCACRGQTRLLPVDFSVNPQRLISVKYKRVFLQFEYNLSAVTQSFYTFSRFKDNNIIDKDLYVYNNTLEIPDVTGLSGSFRCRVTNQFGSEFSNAAELIVLGKKRIAFLAFLAMLMVPIFRLLPEYKRYFFISPL